MTKILRPDFKNKNLDIKKLEGPADISYLVDHILISYQARSEGLSYSQYRNRLRLLDISTETAIENARNGITINNYLEQQIKTQRLFYYGTLGLMTASILLGIYMAIIQPRTQIDKRLEETTILMST